MCIDVTEVTVRLQEKTIEAILQLQVNLGRHNLILKAFLVGISV